MRMCVRSSVTLTNRRRETCVPTLWRGDCSSSHSGKRVRLRRERSSQVSSNGTSSFDGIHVGVFLGMPDPQDGCRRKRKYSEGQPSVAPLQQLLNQHHQQQQQHQLMPRLVNTPSNHTVSLSFSTLSKCSFNVQVAYGRFVIFVQLHIMLYEAG